MKSLLRKKLYTLYTAPMYYRLRGVILLSILSVILSCAPVAQSALTAVPAASTSPTPKATAESEPAAGAVFEVPQVTPTAKACGIVTAVKAVNMRAQPTIHSRVIKWLPAKTEVIVLAQGDWWMVQAGEQIGYVKAEYIGECE